MIVAGSPRIWIPMLIVFGSAIAAGPGLAQRDWPGAPPAREEVTARPATPSVAQPAKLTEATAPVEASRPYMYLAEVIGAPRYAVLGLVLLAGYLLPCLFYLGLLRGTSLDPGQSAALCLVVGAVGAAPGVQLLMARIVYADGEPIPWWKQTEPIGWTAGIFVSLLLLGLVAWFTRARVNTQAGA